jgi:hypothetical protein
VPTGAGPGRWVDAATSLCAAGIHACEPSQLPYWLDAELWEIELAGSVERAERKLVAARGRLLRRVGGWDDAAMVDFSRTCRERVAERSRTEPNLAGYLGDTSWTRPGTAGFVAARVAELAEGVEAYEAERRRQAAWLVERLGL